VHQLDPGKYFVIIDGSDEKQHGKYTLTVTKCSTADKNACRKTTR
jgi:hypothetical protein